MGCPKKIQSVILAVDAQVVLSWLVSKKIKTNNLFVRNRLTEIKTLTEHLVLTYGVNIVPKYVPTSENNADLLSRGITLNKFREIFPKWINGPSWLTFGLENWLEGTLGCLSASNQTQLNFYSSQTSAVCTALNPTAAGLPAPFLTVQNYF